MVPGLSPAATVASAVLLVLAMRSHFSGSAWGPKETEGSGAPTVEVAVAPSGSLSWLSPVLATSAATLCLVLCLRRLRRRSIRSPEVPRAVLIPSVAAIVTEVDSKGVEAWLASSLQNSPTRDSPSPLRQRAGAGKNSGPHTVAEPAKDPATLAEETSAPAQQAERAARAARAAAPEGATAEAVFLSQQSSRQVPPRQTPATGAGSHKKIWVPKGKGA